MKWVLLIVSVTLLIGCKDIGNSTETELYSNLPLGFEAPILSADNTDSKAKIELGKALFFDTQLSKNNNISCASCHKPELAFSDSLPLSIGTNDSLGFRNTPSIVNVAYKQLFHADGGVPTIELQVLAPILDSNELGQDFMVILEYLQTSPVYTKLFHAAFDTTPTIFGLTRSIASYQRSLIYGNSDYDLYLNGDSNALTNSQLNGLKLFNSQRLKCNQCHSGRLLSDFTFRNIGLAHQESDSGRARITSNPEDAGKFVVPSLRNVSITGPYMHDGSMKTLDEVIDYFEKGGGTHLNKSELIKGFKISREEKRDLIHFLEAFTDKEFKKI